MLDQVKVCDPEPIWVRLG